MPPLFRALSPGANRRQFTAALALAALTQTFPFTALAQTPPISDIEWTVEEISGSEVLGSSAPTLTIAQDGRVSGHGGCNRFFATATIDGDRIGFSEIGSTFMACEKPVMDLEAAYFSALGDVVTYRIDAGRLLLLDAQGQVAVALAASV